MLLNLPKIVISQMIKFWEVKPTTALKTPNN
jgi:hypothetical protein